MPVVEIPLSKVGLLTPADIAADLGCDPRTVKLWITGGLLPAVVVGSGQRVTYLVRQADYAAFERPQRGWVPGRPRKPQE